MHRKIAIVVQRYGLEVVGGAELLTRQLAERLHSSLGWDVDIFTTTARDYMTWSNEFKEGTEVVNGVTVRRFNTRMSRARFFGFYDRVTAPWIRRFRRRHLTKPFGLLLEILWILLQGPYCPKLIGALKKTEKNYEKIIFVTYLYYPTLAGIRHFRDKAILIPLAHDEHAFHFQLVERMLRSVKCIITNTEPEAALIQPKLAGAPAVIDTAGVGFDDAMFVPSVSRRVGAPYLLYLGRISAGKGVQSLVDWFEALGDDERFKGVKLLLAGHKEDSVVIPKGPRFEYLGYVDDTTKLALMRDALVLINPSAHESLSLIVIEAMALHVPVLVNANCEVLRYYTERVPTAFGFRDQASFNQHLVKILETDWHGESERANLATARSWALQLFSWTNILSVYERHVGAR